MLFLCGGYFILKSGGFPFRCPRRIIGTLLRKKDGKSSFSALTLALAGTLGVGNITGVAAAIAAGGAGALFWMWISALVAMMVKFCEIVLAMEHRRWDGTRFLGGAMYYMKGKPAAGIFALFCLLTAFTMGSVMQIKAAADAVELVFAVDRRIFGIIFAIFLFAVICGGVKGIKEITVKLIPLLTLFYIGLSVWIIVQNHSALPDAFREIFMSAFGLRPAVSGVCGMMIARALRFGVARGLITNESGCGTAPMAHASAERVSPAEQGVWGIFEVFVDTILLCTLTGLALLTSGIDIGENSMAAVFEAFSCAGIASSAALAVSILLFAFATVICWYYYGGEALIYLDRKKRFIKAYPIVFIAVCVIGATAAEGIVWQCADLTVGAMTMINLCALLRNRKKILEEIALYTNIKTPEILPGLEN
ncbi:MAG: amino acid carrier protein [Clostridia bacterium]|nr:amino acid carrier protein [Clostridia bacterium]